MTQEREHSQFFGYGDSLPIVVFGLLDLRRVAMRSDFTE
jgi:hypothetical protein